MCLGCDYYVTEVRKFSAHSRNRCVMKITKYPRAIQGIIIHTSLFFDEIKVRNCFLQKGFVQWNAISLAYLHSVRVLRLSANVKFACNNVRLFNAGEISLQYSLRFFDIRMRRNSGSSALSAFDCEEALYIVTSCIL